MELDADGLVKIINACGKQGVSKLCLGEGVELVFGIEKSEVINHEPLSSLVNVELPIGVQEFEEDDSPEEGEGRDVYMMALEDPDEFVQYAQKKGFKSEEGLENEEA